MGHGHSHGSEGHEDVAVRRDIARLLSALAVALAVLTVVGIVLLRPTGRIESAADAVGLTSARYSATVTAVTPQPCSYSDGTASQSCVVVEVRPSGGTAKGGTIELAEFNLRDPFVPHLSAGDHIVVSYEPSTDTYAYADRERRAPLLLLTVLFGLAVVAVGRLRGIAALAALAGTVVALLKFIVPAVLDGRSPVLVAVVGASAIAFFVLYLANGFSAATTVALLGTLGALGVTAALGALFFAFSHFSGGASEEASYLPAVTASIDIRGLLLGGVIIGALGALDDMTVTQASAVWELRRANPNMSGRALHRSAMRIGRDHIGSTVNTLLLAYAGASMPLMLLFVLSRQSLGNVANSEEVAVEIVRTLVGSIGLVLAVPITTSLAAWVTTPSTIAPEATDASETSSQPEPARQSRLHGLWAWMDRHNP